MAGEPAMSTDTARLLSSQERLSGVVQSVGRRPADVERRRGESTAVFALFTVLYSVVGYWLVVQMHVVGLETLDRFDRGLMIFHDQPAKLAAVGFDFPPLSVLLVAPFTIVPALTRSLVVVPVVSAVFAGLTMMFLNTMMRRAQVIAPWRVAVLGALGLNPLVVMYASIGARSFLWLAFVVAALGALFAWYVTADIRFVMVAGLSYSAAALTGYGSLLWFLVSLVMVGAVLARLGADGREVEGTTVGFAAPTVYVVVLWSALNLVLLTDPFGWITRSSDVAASAGPDALDGMDLGEVARGTVDLVVHGAPIALVVLPALVFAGIARHNSFALWLGLLLGVSVAAPGLAVALHLTGSPLVMSNALPILLVSIIGAVWLARSATSNGTLVAAALTGGLLASIPWTFSAMTDFEHQGLERAFHDAVATGVVQEGALTVDGSVVGYDLERDMADFIRTDVVGESSVLTDDAATYAVILLTGSPSTFFDRVDESDGPWERAARTPATRVDYLLLSTDPRGDLLSTLYPAAAAGTDPQLPVAYSNDRYTLVEVPPDFGFVTGDSADGLLDDAGVPVFPGVDGADVEGGYDGLQGQEGSRP